MAAYPEFMPPILNLNGTWEEILELLYNVFKSDFIDSTPYHDNIPVSVNTTIKPDGRGKEEGFWHVISKNDSHSQARLIDYRRAERLPWARPMMESPPRKEILVYDYYEGTKDKGVRRYIWLKDYDYVIILQRKKKAYFWVTAFYIDKKWKRRDLQKKYEKRQRPPNTDGPRTPSTLGR